MHVLIATDASGTQRLLGVLAVRRGWEGAEVAEGLGHMRSWRPVSWRTSEFRAPASHESRARIRTFRFEHLSLCGTTGG